MVFSVSHRLFLCLGIAVLVCEVFAAPALTDEPDSKLPNIIVILADDLGYGDVGCYNPESRIPTPNLDRMANEGMRFTDAHSPCTVCTPTRYSLMTGRMAFRAANGGRVFTGAGGPSLIQPGELTLPKLLKGKGYETACFGKWHIGMTFYDSNGDPINKGGLESVKRIDYSREIDGGPIDCGFDHFFGTACCPTTDWLYAFIEGKSVPNRPNKQLDKTNLPKHPYANDNRRGMQADDFDLEEVDIKFLEKSQAFLKEHVNKNPEKPFFLFHSTQAVHLPSFPGRQFKGKTDSGPHGDFIFELDYVVGELFKTLKELDIDENTIVIFTSDNGPEVPSVINMRKDHQHDGARPWRGVKRDNWEGGHRVPFIVRWPGEIPAGSTSNEMTSLTDVFATLAEVVDESIPDSAAADSFSMLPAMKGNDLSKPIRPYILQQGFGGKRYLAIRRGNWKYLAHKGSGGNNYGEKSQMHPYQLPDTAPEAPGQLYDLDRDPGETTNLALERAEIATELNDLLQKSLKDGRSVPRRNTGPASSEGQDVLSVDQLEGLPTRIGFGSCGNQTKPQPILNRIVEREPSLFIYLGDNIYGDTKDMKVLQAKYDMLGEKPEFQRLRASVPVLSVWDDHDYGWNDAGKEYEFKNESKEIFMDFWRVPEDSPRRSHSGIYGVHRFEEGTRSVQIILLDTRTFRDRLKVNSKPIPKGLKNAYQPDSDASKTLLGEQQWAWLEGVLKEPADLRIICSSIQFGHEYNGWESWTNLPLEQEKMFKIIDETRAEGVIFVSGDVHWGEISKREYENRYPLYDVTASGLTEEWYNVESNKFRVGKAYRENHFGLIEIDWGQVDPAIDFKIIGLDGEEKVTHSTSRSKLQFQDE